MSRIEKIGDATLYLGDCLEIMPVLAPVDHLVSDPPYEDSLHESKKNTAKKRIRNDHGSDLRALGFEGINSIRNEVVVKGGPITKGWFIAFCTAEGVARWADVINASPMKYKRACVWVKPDCAPQMNGQGPAMGAEMFVCAWAGSGYANWNAGGKRGVYQHAINVDRSGEHPAEKPIALMMEIVADFTTHGQTILDPFMGSGTTGVAAIKLGRKFIGIERDPKWFDLSCKRIAKAWEQPRLFEAPARKGKQMSLLGGAK